MTNLLNKLPFIFILILIKAFLVSEVSAQMFTVGNNGSRPQTPPSSAVYFGLQPYEFERQGELGEDDLDYTFNEAIYTMRVEIPGFEFFGNYGPNIVSPDDQNINYYNVGIQLTGGMNVFTRESYSFILPLEISTEFTNVAAEGETQTSREFRQSALMIGTGISFNWRPANNVRLTTRGLPMIGFSVSSHSGEGGVKYKFENRNRIYVDNIINRFGLVFGVDFRLSSLDTSEEQFQYDSYGNALMIGVSF